MKLSSTAQVSSLLALAGVCFVAEAQSRNRITVRTYRTNYRVDTWDDGRDDPYRVTFWKFGLKSVYTFDAAGHVKTLTARNTLYTFTLSVPSRKLLTSSDDDIEDSLDFDAGAEIGCSTCEVTWNTVCDVGLREVCFLDAIKPAAFDEDGIDSVRRFCTSFGESCKTSASELCAGQCTDHTTTPTPAPTAALTPAPTPEPTLSPTLATTVEPAPSPTAEPTLATTPEPTLATTPEPTPAPTPEPTLSPTLATTVEPAPSPTAEPTLATTPEPTLATTPEPTPATTLEPTLATTPEPTPAPTGTVEEGACSPNPCENGGSCSVDPAGGRVCSCTPGFGGMSCQTDTSSLDPFFVEFDFLGTWTDARRAVFQSAADRWSEVITHVPCGGTMQVPGGRLLISATLEVIDGVGGMTGSAGVGSVWSGCSAVSATGTLKFDMADVAVMEADGIFEGVVMHEMGHVIGIGTLWGNNFGECTTCRQTGNPAWTCPTALSVYSDIGGSGADIVEEDGSSSGTTCSNLDEDIFGDELMSAVIDNTVVLSKMTAAVLEDLEYIVDASAVDAYILPSMRDGSFNETPGLARFNDTTVDTVIKVLDAEGDVVEEIIGVTVQF